MDCRRATLLLRTLTTAKNKGEVLVGFPRFRRYEGDEGMNEAPIPKYVGC